MSLESPNLSDGVGADLQVHPVGHVGQGVHVVVDAVADDGGQARLLPAHLDRRRRLAYQLDVLGRGWHCGQGENSYKWVGVTVSLGSGC